VPHALPHRERLVHTGRPGVPDPVGPFAHAVRWRDTLWVTGQMPTDPTTGAVVPGDVADQTRQVLRNLEAVLHASGARLADTLMVRAYLLDFDDYARFNAEYETWFPDGLPARTCVGVTGLAVGALVEIDLVVALPDGDDAPHHRPTQGATR